MKSVFLSLCVLLILFSSCKKNECISEKEIPQWLKDRIEADEAAIDTADARDMINYGAWIRYTYKREFYFEYHNPLMSACCFMYNYDGNSMSYDDIEAYNDEKCCKCFIWKAPRYGELIYKP